MDNKTQQNGIFKTLQIIYGAFMFGIIAFSVVAYYLIIDNDIFTINSNDPFTFVVPVVATSSVFLSNLIYQKMIEKISKNSNLQSKLGVYQSATIIKGALLESGALIATVVAFISNNSSFLLVSLAMVFVMYLKFPKKEIFKEEVKLSFEEKSEFDRL